MARKLIVSKGHILRLKWRTEHALEPETCKEISRISLWVMIGGLIVSIVTTVDFYQSVPPYMYHWKQVVVFFCWMTTVLAYVARVALRAQWSDFQLLVWRTAQRLNLDVENFARSSKQRLGDLAHGCLCEIAMRLQHAERMYPSPYAPERKQLQEEFRQAFDTFKPSGLIPEDATWDRYFGSGPQHGIQEGG